MAPPKKPARATQFSSKIAKDVRPMLQCHYQRVSVEGLQYVEKVLSRLTAGLLGILVSEIEKKCKILTVQDRHGRIKRRLGPNELLQIIGAIPHVNRLASKAGYVSTTLMRRGVLTRLVEIKKKKKASEGSDKFCYLL